MAYDRPTRLSRGCDTIIEAGWLAAVVVTPLFFDIYSHRVFEPDKTAILRSLVLIMGLAWVVRTIELRGYRGRPGRMRMEPLVVAALLVLLVSGIASILSVAPRISLWGSYNRLQGLYTMGAYIAIFLSVVGLMRTREQLERLITTALLTSLPVSLYGIIQYFGTDPMAWEADVTVRVSSTMGNPIFVAAFLVMTVPLAIYRLMVSGGEAVTDESATTRRILVIGGLASLAFQMAAWLSGPVAGTASAIVTVATWVAVSFLLGKPLVPFLRISSYTVLLSAQLMCLVFSQSRGPWLGLAGGLFVFALLWTIIRGRRRQALAVIGSGLIILSAVVSINWSESPVGFVRKIPYLGRVGQLAKIEGGSGRVRVLIWEGVSELITDDPVRAVVGYGPETLRLVYPPYHRPELGRIHEPDALADRAHNEIFDVLVTTGFVGLAAYLLFITGLFYCGLGWLGLLQTRQARITFLWLWFGGGALAVALAVFIDAGWRFTGIALPIGLFAGLLAFLCIRAFKGSTDSGDQSDSEEDRPGLIVVAILAIVTAHFLETQIGLSIVASQTYFWVFAGVLAVFVHHHSGPAFTTSPRHVEATPGWTASASLVTALILVTLIYDFYFPNVDLGRMSSAIWLLVFTWLFGGLLVIPESGPTWRKATLRYSSLALVPTLLYVMIHGSMLSRGVGEENLIIGYVIAIVLIILMLAFTPVQTEVELPRLRSVWLGLSYLIWAFAAIFLVNATNLNVIRADIQFRKSSRYLARQQYPEAVAALRRTVDLEPKQDTYRLFLGKALLGQAKASGVPDSLMIEAERTLMKARELSPLDPNHAANLARLHRAWAEETAPGQDRSERFDRALAEFEEATVLSPKTPYLWNDRGAAYLAAGDTADAERMFLHSLDLDNRFYQTHLFIGNLRFVQKRWKEAVLAYQETLRLEPQLPLVRINLAVAKAEADRQEVDSVLEIR